MEYLPRKVYGILMMEVLSTDTFLFTQDLITFIDDLSFHPRSLITSALLNRGNNPSII